LVKHPDSGLVAVLSDAPRPDLRKTILPVVRQHPVPAHRRLLEQLLTDPDEQVRSEAQKVRHELEELAATPPSAYALETLGGSGGDERLH
jgi:hypothetical protein